jgi:2-dehydro-3-deoxygluconokinase
VFPGGSEANVATALSQMGEKVYYFSAFPSHGLSGEILQKLTDLRVDTSKVLHFGDRIGSYILLSANGLTKGEVIYDRKYSSFSLLTADELDYDALFEGIDWFHWTALTPALNEKWAVLMKRILVEAERRGVTISVDLNYRNRLWQYGQEPIEVMPDLVEHCDVLMGNIWAANKMLGTSIDDALDRQTSVEVYAAYSARSAREIFAKFPKIKHVANTFRFMDNPTHNYFYGVYHNATTNATSRIYETNNVVDRIGSGDAFMGGFIHALRNTNDPQRIIDIATGAGYQKLFVEGDFGNGKF